MQKRKFKIAIYDVIVNVCIFDNITSLDKYWRKLAKKFSIDDDDEGLCYACVFFNPNDFNEVFYLISKPNISHNLIAHENTHLALGIFQYNNIHVNLDDHEPLALLTGYIADNIYRLVEK